MQSTRPPPGWRLPRAVRGLAAQGVKASLHADLDRCCSPAPGFALDLPVEAPFVLRLEGVDEGTLLILRQREDGWGLLTPTCADEALQIGQLRPVPTDPCDVMLVTGPRPRVEGWAVVVYPEPIDWSAAEATRWRPIQERLADGDLAWVSLRVGVRAR